MWYTGTDNDHDPTVGYAYYSPPSPHGISGGGGGGAPEPEPGITDVSNIVTSQGIFTKTTTAVSEDGNVVLTIAKDTIGLTAEGEPLSEISITEMEEPPAPSADCEVIGLTYNLDPMALFLSCP